MDIRTLRPLAAVLAAGAAALALAQVPAEPGATTQPTPEEKRTYAQEPIASTSTGGSGPTASVAGTIAEALNADRSLQGSKFTVIGEDKALLITGVTPSLRQMAQAVQVARQHAGDLAVRTSISTEEVVIDAVATAPDAALLVPADEASRMSEREIASRPQQPQPANPS